VPIASPADTTALQKAVFKSSRPVNPVSRNEVAFD
jgi:hypothetical protein